MQLFETNATTESDRKFWKHKSIVESSASSSDHAKIIRLQKPDVYPKSIPELLNLEEVSDAEYAKILERIHKSDTCVPDRNLIKKLLVGSFDYDLLFGIHEYLTLSEGDNTDAAAILTKSTEGTNSFGNIFIDIQSGSLGLATTESQSHEGRENIPMDELIGSIPVCTDSVKTQLNVECKHLQRLMCRQASQLRKNALVKTDVYPEIGYKKLGSGEPRGNSEGSTGNICATCTTGIGSTFGSEYSGSGYIDRSNPEPSAKRGIDFQCRRKRRKPWGSLSLWETTRLVTRKWFALDSARISVIYEEAGAPSKPKKCIRLSNILSQNECIIKASGSFIRQRLFSSNKHNQAGYPGSKFTSAEQRCEMHEDSVGATSWRQCYRLGSDGIVLSVTERGCIWLKNQSNTSNLPLFVSSPCFPQLPITHSGADWPICRVPPGHSILLYDQNVYMRWEAEMELEPNRKDRKTRCSAFHPPIVHISLGKGWGPSYRRPDITHCPARFELWIDPKQLPYSCF